MSHSLKDVLNDAKPLYIFDTHPIAYRTPVFKLLAEEIPIEVFYFKSQFDGNQWWFKEKNTIPIEHNKPTIPQAISHHFLNYSNLRDFRHSLQNLFEKQLPKAILFYGYYLPEHWILWHTANQFKIPILFVGETFYVGKSIFRRALKTILHPLFFRKISFVISIGDKNFSYYRMLGVSKEKIIPAKYCIDNDAFTLDASSTETVRKEIRKQYSIPENHFVILFVGRLFDRKRPFDMVEIQKKLSTFNTTTVLIGSGPLEDILKRQAPKNFIVAGFQPKEKLRDWYHAADALVIPSRYETWGLVANEAACARLPILCTKYCGISGDLVITGYNGYVYQEGDMDTAATFLKHLIQNPEKHKDMRNKAFQKIQDYHPSQFSQAVLEALSILEENSSLPFASNRSSLNLTRPHGA